MDTRPLPLGLESYNELAAGAHHLLPFQRQQSTAEQQQAPQGREVSPPTFRACLACREAHAACDPERPCRRCVRLGRQCADAPSRKRGRRSALQPFFFLNQPQPVPSSPPSSATISTATTARKLVHGWKGMVASNSSSHDAQEERMPTKKPRAAAAAETRTRPTATGITADGVAERFEQSSRQKLEQKVMQLELMVEQLTAELGDQIRELLDSNAQLHDRVRRLEAQIETCTSPQWSEGSASSISGTPTSPESKAFSFELSILHSGISPALALEARQQMPWLCHYELPARFPVPSFRYPVAVFSKLSTLELPPVCSYANAEFVQLTKMPWSELIGRPYSTLFTVYKDNARRYTPILYNQRPMSPSKVFSFNALLRCKDGSTLRLCDQSQFYFDSLGQAQHAVICVLGSCNDGMREGEQFDQWVPIPYMHDPKLAAENRVS